MEQHTIALFGEAEQGELNCLLAIHSLEELADRLGNPPEHSQGIDFAVQALLFQRNLFYIRVEEEGFSRADYYHGFKLLVGCHGKIPPISAIFLPGVGDSDIIEATEPVIDLYRSLIVTTERDLYDYLTAIGNR